MRIRFSFRLLLLVLLLVLPLQFSVSGEDSPKADSLPNTGQKNQPLDEAFQKDLPENIADLKKMQDQIVEVTKKVMPSVVSVRIGNAQGSGVIVSEDGYVLTAAHVAGKEGLPVVFILPGGKRVTGTTLGIINDYDAGLLKIKTKGKWPAAPMGNSDDLKPGDWCLSLGHPNGYMYARDPIARIGRIVTNRESVIQTDCTLVGGDSGGPLFDMKGNVIGIHSRIGMANGWNFHSPVTAYKENWEQLASAKEFEKEIKLPRAFLGVSGKDNPDGCLVTAVIQGYPAEKAGLKVGDVIQKIDKKKVNGFQGLYQLIGNYQPGQKISISILRNNKSIDLETVLHR